MRPKYVTEILGVKVPHQLNADLHLIDWMHEQGYTFDVVADEDLHREGRGLLESYKVVLTGTHPEYWSQEMIRGCQQYLCGGGRMMYLGGNGMYWVTQLDREAGHTIEMRRAQPSSPHFFDPHPGELHLSTTAQRAAPWRHRGLSTQSWLGVVMSGAGRTGQHYIRKPDSFDPRAAWIFEGIGRNELIGNFANLHCGYGAAGGEVDRVDRKLEGTPQHTMVLATTAPFDGTWLNDPLDAPCNPRGDMALLEYPNGGAVFATGSIAWCSCLSYNGYRNNVSRLTRNVLDGFLNRK
jgi:N,N-dimethylformamidase